MDTISINNKFKFPINTCDFYIWLYIIYRLQDIVYPQGIINQVLVVVIISWSFWLGLRYFIPNPQNGRFLNATVILIGMYIIYGLLYIFYPLSNLSFLPGPHRYLINSLFSLLPVLVFYTFVQKGKLNSRKIAFYAILFLILSIIHYYHNLDKVIEDFYNQYGREVDEITNNIGYEFVGLIPALLFIRHKPIRYVTLAIVLVYTYLSFKRGAILIGTLATVWILVKEISNSKGGYNKIFSLLIVTILVIAAFYFVGDLYETSDMLQKRIEATQKGNSSGRDTIYVTLWTAFCDRNNIFNLLFGEGANVTIKYAGNYAHQDWLETLINNGLLGIVILGNFFYSFALAVFGLRGKVNKRLMTSFQLLLFIIFAKSLFSMSIQNLNFTSTMLLGYLLFLSHYKKEKSFIRLRN